MFRYLDALSKGGQDVHSIDTYVLALQFSISISGTDKSATWSEQFPLWANQWKEESRLPCC